MADVQILAPGVEAAPLAFTVPPAVEILLKSARASFDGTAASSAWLPAVRLTSPAGVTQVVARTDDTVAAGASADVSFFPGVKQTAGSPLRYARFFSASQTSHAGARIQHFVSCLTNAPDVFSIDGSDDTHCHVNAAGDFLFVVYFSINTAAGHTYATNFSTALTTVASSTVIQASNILVKGQTDLTILTIGGGIAGYATVYHATASGAADFHASVSPDDGRSTPTFQEVDVFWLNGGSTFGGGGGGGSDVTSLAVTGNPPLVGDVLLAAGSNVTLTQAGQTITVASSGGGGAELGYHEIVSDPVISSTSESAPTLVAALGAITYAAVPTLITFETPKAYTIGGNILILSLWDGVPGSGGVNLGYLASFDARGVSSGFNTGFPVSRTVRLTPSAGSHDYGVYGFVLIGSATSTGVSAGSGGAGTFLPSYIRAVTA